VAVASSLPTHCFSNDHSRADLPLETTSDLLVLNVSQRRSKPRHCTLLSDTAVAVEQARHPRPSYSHVTCFRPIFKA
jgi:hypothetical protein